MSSTSVRERLTFLDDGRVLACLMVVIYHTVGTISQDSYFGAHPFGDYITFSDVRMPFFFAMSGFLLSWFSLRDPKPGLATSRAFLVKKIFRIYPLFWVVFVAVCAMSVATRKAIPNGTDMLAALTLFPLPPEVGGPSLGGTRPPLIYPTWTLQFEMIAIVILAVAMSHRWLLRAYLVGFPVFHLVSGHPNFALSVIGSDWLFIFWAGVVAAQLTRKLDTRQKDGFLWLAVAVLTLCMGLHFLLNRAYPEGVEGLELNLPYGLGFAMLMIGLSRFTNTTPYSFQPWHRQIIMKLSAWSFAIFLIHAPIISLVCKLMVSIGFKGDAAWFLALLVSFISAVLAGAVLHHWVERPLIKLSFHWPINPTKESQNGTTRFGD